jgi:translation initiation factor 2B subunit (eIF-2B alpha/beta/delta family)
LKPIYYILVKQMLDDLTHRINIIREDKFHGAGWLTLSFINEIEGISSEFIKARPGMVSIANYVALYNLQIQTSARKYRNLHPLQNEAITRGRELQKRMERNTVRAALNCAGTIADGDVVMTCSFSSLVCQSLAEAKKLGREFNVIICQSLIESISYGEQTRQKLNESDIAHEIINDNMIRQYVRRASRVLLGADAVLSSGEIINGVPSLQLAASAAIMSTPLTIVCESTKFDAHAHLGKEYALEPGFDKIACGLWTQIITESGSVNKDSFGKYMDKLRATF